MELIASSRSLSANEKNKILDILRNTKADLDTYIAKRNDIDSKVKDLFAKIILENYRDR